MYYVNILFSFDRILWSDLGLIAGKAQFSSDPETKLTGYPWSASVIIVEDFGQVCLVWNINIFFLSAIKDLHVLRGGRVLLQNNLRYLSVHIGIYTVLNQSRSSVILLTFSLHLVHLVKFTIFKQRFWLFRLLTS